MKAILAVSADGYMSRCRDDTMDWLGPTDKAVFRILTSVGGRLLASRNTLSLMPAHLQGRTLTALSSRGYVSGESWGHLIDAEFVYPTAWLIGGPNLVLHALKENLLFEVHLCRSDRLADPVHSLGPIKDPVTPWLEASTEINRRPYDMPWHVTLETRVNDVVVQCWKPYVTL